MRTWEVTLLVKGAIKVERQIKFGTEKELQLGNIFRSDITIGNFKNGIKITSTVYTENINNAYKIASLFIGKMLDVLTIRLDIPLIAEEDLGITITDENRVKAIIGKREFKECFELSRDLNLNETAYLRALSWFRKGLNSNDPFDKFLAFWNAISVVSGKYHTRNNRTAGGIINQIWDCFITLWGDDCNNWNIIDGDNRWINNRNDIRNNIAHGVIPVEVNYVEDVISKIDDVQKIANTFIKEWGNNQLNRRI
jgi:hypothetical protein